MSSNFTSIRRAVAAKLLSVPAVYAIAGARIRPLVLNQDDAFPAITFVLTQAGYEPGIDGYDELPSPQFEITCWALIHDDAAELADLVAAALEDEGESTWSPSSGNVTVTASTLLNMRDVMAENVEGGDKPVFGVALTFQFQFRQ